MYGMIEIRVVVKNHIASVTFRIELAFFEKYFFAEVLPRIRTVVLADSVLYGGFGYTLFALRYMLVYSLSYDRFRNSRFFAQFGGRYWFGYSDGIFYFRTLFISADNSKEQITASNGEQRKDNKRAYICGKLGKRIYENSGNGAPERVARKTVYRIFIAG